MKPDLSIIPEPDTTVEIRKPLTKKQRAQMALDQGGICGCGCGVKLDHGREGTIDEHLNPLGLTGTNALENRSIWRKPCSLAKTKTDLGNIAHAKKMGRETGQQARRAQNGPTMKSRPFPKGSRKIESRPFEKRKK